MTFCRTRLAAVAASLSTGAMRATVAAAAGALGLAIPMTANAAPTPPPALTTMPSSFTFVPPAVGPISVDLGATIINGQQIAPPVHVLSPGVAPPPITWTVSGGWSTSPAGS